MQTPAPQLQSMTLRDVQMDYFVRKKPHDTTLPFAVFLSRRCLTKINLGSAVISDPWTKFAFISYRRVLRLSWPGLDFLVLFTAMCYFPPLPAGTDMD